ncbi:phosphatase PAP2 family protein [bacterium]|nr:phosphatase PAP2 family protein [bacterium]
MEMLQKLDWTITEFINFNMSHPFLNKFFPIITNIHHGKEIFGYIFYALIIAWLALKKTKALKVLAALVLTLAITDSISYHLIKNNVKRVRPNNNLKVMTVTRTYGPKSYSFPSNHAVNSTAAAVVLSFFYFKFAPLFYIWAFLIAYSRVYVGVHFVSDVIGGALIGFLMGKFFVLFVFRRFKFFMTAL